MAGSIKVGWRLIGGLLVASIPINRPWRYTDISPYRIRSDWGGAVADISGFAMKNIRRREFIFLLGGAVAVWSFGAHAQQAAQPAALTGFRFRLQADAVGQARHQYRNVSAHGR